MSFTDFGLIGKAVDVVRNRFAARDEKKLRERFSQIVNRLKGANCYIPPFGSPEYWEAETMADRGWLQRVPPFGYMLRGPLNRTRF
jgi:hypothetical protein